MNIFLAQPWVVHMGILVVGGYLIWAWRPLIAQSWQLHRSVRKLTQIATHTTQITSEQKRDIATTFKGSVLFVPGAWSGLVGAFRPTLLLGTELLSTLSHAELHAVLAHEEAHRQRRDPLFRALLIFSSRLVPSIGMELFTRWSQRIEEICDQFAAHHTHDPLTVASALLQTRRLQLKSLSKIASTQSMCPLFTGFTQHSCVEERITQLLALPHRTPLPRSPRLGDFLLSKTAFVLLLLQVPLHHTLEYIVFLIN